MRGSFYWRSWRGTKNFSTAPGLLMPSRPLLFLYHLARVHQEDRSSNLARSRPLPKNVLSKCMLRTCYPNAHSECAIQVHTQNVLSKCTPKNVLSKCSLRTCYPSVRYTRVLLVHHQSRAPLVLVHLSCITCTCAPISCTSTLVHPTRAPISCTTNLVHQTRASLVLVHPSYLCTHLVHLYSRALISCTTNLVHHYTILCTSRAPLVHLSAILCTTA